MTPEYGAEAVDLWEEFNNPKTSWPRKIHILYTLAYQANSVMDYDNEYTYLASALEIAKEQKLAKEGIELRLTLARVLNNTLDEPQRALEIANEAEALLPEFTVDVEELTNKAALTQIKGKIFVVLERYHEAIYQWNAHAELSTLINSQPGVAYGYEQLARCYIEIHELEQAKKYAELARVIYRENARVGDVCDVDRVLARVLLERGHAKKAALVLKGIRRAERLVNGRSSDETKLWLAVALSASQDYDQAEKVFRRIIKDSLNSRKAEFKIGLLAARYLSFMLGELGRTEERDELWESIREVESRLPNFDQADDQVRRAEINTLLVGGHVDEALMAAGEFTVDKSEKGEIDGRWVGIFDTLRCHRERNDAEAIVIVWDSISHSSLEFQDDLVIPLKNMVSHALAVIGRIEEAVELNNQVLADYRLDQSLQEKAYAHENKARFLKTLKKSLAAKKWIDLAIEENMEAGNINRALMLSKTFRTKGKSITSEESPESYQ